MARIIAPTRNNALRFAVLLAAAALLFGALLVASTANAHADEATDAAVAEVVAYVQQNSDGTELENVKAVHDWFFDNVKPASSGNDESAALVQKSANPLGFSKGMVAVFDALGIEAEVAANNTSGNTYYYWTRVKVGQSWYNVDTYLCTNSTDNATGTKPAESLRYSYFLKSDAWFAADGVKVGSGALAHDKYAPDAHPGTDTAYDSRTYTDWSGVALVTITKTRTIRYVDAAGSEVNTETQTLKWYQVPENADLSKYSGEFAGKAAEAPSGYTPAVQTIPALTITADAAYPVFIVNVIKDASSDSGSSGSGTSDTATPIKVEFARIINISYEGGKASTVRDKASETFPAGTSVANQTYDFPAKAVGNYITGGIPEGYYAVPATIPAVTLSASNPERTYNVTLKKIASAWSSIELKRVIVCEAADGTYTSKTQKYTAEYLKDTPLSQVSYTFKGGALKDFVNIPSGYTPSVTTVPDITVKGDNPTITYTVKLTKNSSGGSGSTARTWVRLKGATAYDTMASIVQAGWNGTGGTVVIATGNGFPDALCSAGAAGLENAPILLTDGKKLSAQTRNELKRLKPKRVVIVGGRAAVSESAEAQIKSVASGAEMFRFKGAKASDTAVALNKGYNVGSNWRSSTAIVATSKGYQDALSAAPIAYAMKYPVFLTDDKNTISDATLQGMLDCNVKRVVIVGGRGAVSEKVEQRLKAYFGVGNVFRKKGATAYDTSKEVAEWGIALGLSADKMGVACGTGYQDALCGAALCGKNRSVIVLADKKDYKTCLPIASNNKAKITYGYVYGGRGVVPANVQNSYESASGCAKTTKW